MKIIIDTREQSPLTFSNSMVTEVIVRKLDVGDYGCEFEDGHVPPFVFERKSLNDLFGTMGNGYERFKQEIVRSQKNQTQMFLIVEGTLMDVARGVEYSSLKGLSVVAKMFTLWVKYSVQPIFVADRREMSEYITHFFIAVGKQYIKNKNAQRQS